MIEVTDITKRFGRILAVDRVSIRVKRGDVLGFLGPNGAGKSTAMRMMAGYLQPTSGSVRINGMSYDEDPVRPRALIGYMPESNPLYGEMTAREFLRFIADIHGIENLDKRVDEVIKMTNIGEISAQLIETISKGYRTRLSFASAIIHDPPILLLDEPTDGLDPNQKNEIRGLINRFSKEKAIVVSTHILEEVEAMCTRIAIISEGRLILDGTSEDLRNYSENNNKVVVSLRPGDRVKVEGLLSSGLTPVGAVSEGFERFRIENRATPDSVMNKLSNSNVSFGEIFCFHPPLDEAFRKMTISRE